MRGVRRWSLLSQPDSGIRDNENLPEKKIFFEFKVATYSSSHNKMLPSLLLTLASAALVSAHTVITYPGWRGDNLKTTEEFPYGMQWMYPCESCKLSLSPFNLSFPIWVLTKTAPYEVNLLTLVVLLQVVELGPQKTGHIGRQQVVLSPSSRVGSKATRPPSYT